MSTLLTRPQLAAKIKAKYPEYGDIDDYELVNKVVAKHPEYGDVLDPEEASVVNAADVVDLPKAPHGDKVPDEAPATPRPLTPPPGVLDSWNQTQTDLNIGGAKGLGQAAINLANVGGELTGVRPIARAVSGTDPKIPTPTALQSEGSAQGLGAFAGRAFPAALTAPLGGIGGAALGGAVAGAAESGEPLGALAGAGFGAAGGVAAKVAAPALNKLGEGVKPLVRAVADSEMLENAVDATGLVPIVGGQLNRLGRGVLGGARLISKALGSASDDATRVLEQEAAAHAVNSGTKPGPAFPPPPGMGASGPPPAPVVRPGAPTSSTSLTPTPASAPKVTFTVGKPKPTKPLTPPPTATEVTEGLKPGKASPQEIGAKIREWKAAGEDVGAKLRAQHAEGAPLDAEDISTAKEILKQAGSFEKAKTLLDGLDYTAAEKRSLLRALREAGDAK